MENYKTRYRKLIVIDYDILIQCMKHSYSIRDGQSGENIISEKMFQLISRLTSEKSNLVLIMTNKDKTVIDDRLLRIENLNIGCENGFVFRVNKGANWRWKYLYDFSVGW